MLASRFGESTTIVLTSAALKEDEGKSAKRTSMCGSLLADCAPAMNHPNVMMSHGCTDSAGSTTCMHKHNIQVVGAVGEGKQEEHGPPFRSKLHVCAPCAHVYL